MKEKEKVGGRQRRKKKGEALRSYGYTYVYGVDSRLHPLIVQTMLRINVYIMNVM